MTEEKVLHDEFCLVSVISHISEVLMLLALNLMLTLMLRLVIKGLGQLGLQEWRGGAIPEESAGE